MCFSLPWTRGRERSYSTPKGGEPAPRCLTREALREERLPRTGFPPLTAKTHRPRPHPTRRRSLELRPEEANPESPHGPGPAAQRLKKETAAARPKPVRGGSSRWCRLPFLRSPRRKAGSPASGTATYLLDGEELQQREDQVPVQEVCDLGSQVVLRHLGDRKEKKEAGPSGARGGGQPRLLWALRMSGPAGGRGAAAPAQCSDRVWGPLSGWRCRVWLGDVNGAFPGVWVVCCVGAEGVAGRNPRLVSAPWLGADVGPSWVQGAVGPGLRRDEAGPCLA